MALGRFLKNLIDRWTGRGQRDELAPVEYDPAVDDDYQRTGRYPRSSRDAEIQEECFPKEPRSFLRELDACPDELLTYSERQMKYLMREWGRSF